MRTLIWNLSEIDNYSNELKLYKFLVYKITRITDNRCYIGISKQSMYNRLYNKLYGHLIRYKDSNSELYSSMRNLGLSNFELEIIKFCTDLIDLNDSEIEYIKLYNSYSNGFNIRRGGFIKVVNLDGNEILLSEVPESRINDITIKKYSREDLNNRSLINNGLIMRRVKHYELSYYLDLGWKLGGLDSMKSSKGKRIVSNQITRESKFINDYEVDSYLSSGWVLGRISESPMKGKMRYTNGIVNILISNNELVPEGFHKGFSKFNNRKGNSGRIFINNGRIDKCILESELNNYLSDKSWKLGRLNSPSKDKIWINNGTKNKRINQDKLDDYLNSGYKLGRLNAPNLGKVWISNINNPNDKLMINKIELDHYLSLGYRKGFSKIKK